jgi:hypothetical protein
MAFETMSFFFVPWLTKRQWLKWNMSFHLKWCSVVFSLDLDYDFGFNKKKTTSFCKVEVYYNLGIFVPFSFGP